MGLVNLIKNLDSSTKTRLLGDKITRILRFTFVENDNYAIEPSIVDEAVAIQKGKDLVRRNRGLLIESLRSSKIISLGFQNYEDAVNFYETNLEKFIKDFDIEDEYIEEPQVDLRESHETLIPKYGECNGINAFPHDYQQRLKNLILNQFFNNLNPIILASMPTGAGKTVLAMEIILDLFRSYEVFRNKPINILWVVTSKELTEQSLKSFQKLWKQKGDHAVTTERYFGKFNFLNYKYSSKITFATFDLLVSRMKQEDVQSLLKQTDFLIIDEAHSSEANTYFEVIRNYKLVNENHKILGLTATPYRSDDDEFKSLKDLFNEYLVLTDENGKGVESPLQYLIERKFLSKINFEVLNVPEGEVSKSEYFRTLHNSILVECQLLIENGENTIIFAKSKAHAIALSIYLTRNEVANGLIVGETSEIKREEYLTNFGDKNHPLSVLVNHQILSTGIDVPGMNSIMILSDINSPTLALQVLGRAMRGPKNGGNPENKIFLTPTNEKKLTNYKILESIVLK
jgi:DNA repair protein RadD